ncbi:MAG: 3-oxoadipate enol-lactonase [Mycobacterium sp.]|nr:3-oxoadipate enol-lactonase [Mycobacterium sp.]
MALSVNYTTTSDGCRLAWRRDGTAAGVPLLFCNSIGTSLELWDAQVIALQHDFDVIRFDTRGHGGSDAPDGDYNLTALARDAIQVLNAAGLDRANICGISLGGITAMRLALDFPHRVQRLVLGDTAARIGTSQSWEKRRRTVLTGGLAPIADVAMERFFSPEFRHHRPETVTRFRQALLDTSAAGYAGCCAALRDADLTLDVNRIEIPTLVIAGLRDVSTTPAQLRALAAAITGSQLAELDAAHLSNVERPEEFSRMVGSFFLRSAAH